MRDSRGGSGAGIGGRAVVNDLNRKTTGNLGAVVFFETDFLSMCR